MAFFTRLCIVASVGSALIACSSEDSPGSSGGTGNGGSAAQASGGASGSGGTSAPLAGSANGGGGAAGGGTGGGGGSAGAGAAGEAGTAGTAGSGGAGGSVGTGGALGGTAGAGGSAGSGTGGTGGSVGGSAGGVGGTAGAGITYPSPTAVLEVLDRANTQFVNKWPDPAKDINSGRDSSIWTRAVYYEGLMNLYSVAPEMKYYKYAVDWGTAHSWNLRNGDNTTTSADNQCAGQTYLELYVIDGKKDAVRVTGIKRSVDGMVASATNNTWTWVDALQMAMPVFARLGVLQSDTKYFDKMWSLYASARNTQGSGGFYNPTDKLWWRDAVWKPMKTPNGKQTYWSRGNGWVFAALARTLDLIPANETHRADYEKDFKDMAEALRAVQRSDGFWNVSLADPDHFAGPEVSGTSLFVYGMAWGIRKGYLSEAVYGPLVTRAWNAMNTVAVQPNGFIGYMQSTGDDPSDGQPLTKDKVPDYEDYGVGCFLLAGSELVKLAKKL